MTTTTTTVMMSIIGDSEEPFASHKIHDNNPTYKNQLQEVCNL